MKDNIIPMRRPVAAHPKPSLLKFRIHYSENIPGLSNDFIIGAQSIEVCARVVAQIFPGRGDFTVEQI
jgi:hypothetical protein